MKLQLWELFFIRLINDSNILENDRLDQKKEKKDKNEYFPFADLFGFLTFSLEFSIFRWFHFEY